MKTLLPVLAGLFILAPMAASAAQITSAPVSSAASGAPLYLYVPSINLFTAIQGVGVNTKGNMDVPSGRSNNVGWYQYGIVPGNLGTAVLDAHNTAAFRTLNNVPVGADIYVYNTSGTWLHFAVTKERTYSMATLSPVTLFEPANNQMQKLNLITCAGQLLGNGEATHRLIVSAELV